MNGRSLDMAGHKPGGKFQHTNHRRYAMKTYSEPYKGYRVERVYSIDETRVLMDRIYRDDKLVTVAAAGQGFRVVDRISR